ncbi:MAG: S-layer homology domain-containing protein, partial [Ezakiella coagulans]|uniref:S-layer homology domain-containing protein n=1 Tax=Ezakiella coagulans TaxID=46507 RepID=UPI00399B6749
MKKYIALILTGLMLISLMPYKTSADNYLYGDLTVNVYGDDRRPINGAIVTIYDLNGSDVTPSGYYNYNTYTLPYGYYTVVATYMGFEARETVMVDSSTNYVSLTLSTSNNYKYTFVVNTVDRNGFDIKNLDTRVYDQYDREITSVGGLYTIGYAGKYRVDVYSGYKLVKSAYFDYSDIKSGTLTVNIDGGFYAADAPRALTDTLRIAKNIRRCGDYGSVSPALRQNFESNLDIVSNIVDDFKDGKFSYAYNGRYYDKYGKYNNGYYRNYDSYRNGYYYVNGIPYSYYEFYKKFGYYPDQYDNGMGYNYTADWYIDKYNGLSMRYYVEALVDASNAVLGDMPISSLCTRDIGRLSYPSVYDYNGFDTIGSYDNKTVKEANDLIAEARKLKDKRSDSYWKKYSDALQKAIDETNKALKGNGGLKNAVLNLKKAIDDAKKNDGKLYTRRAYMKGITSMTFSPSGTLTRAEMAQIIANLLSQSGKNYSYGAVNFNDVTENSWYYNAVRVASNYGIMVGRPGGNFDPQGLVSKEELIV